MKVCGFALSPLFVLLVPMPAASAAPSASQPLELVQALMTTGLLDALMTSKARGGERIETPYLGFAYQSGWRWTDPPSPGRPLDQQ